jgi:hypothetical protein
MFDPLKITNQSLAFSARTENESTLVVDPLADLLLSVAAIIIIALIAILPHISLQPASGRDSASSSSALPINSSFRLEGRTVEPLVATRRGLAIGGSPSGIIPVDRIFLDQDLIDRMKRMRDHDETIVLLIEPDGLETAFQFDVIANRYGPKRMLQVRLDSDCSHAKSERLALYCRGVAR